MHHSENGWRVRGMHAPPSGASKATQEVCPILNPDPAMRPSKERDSTEVTEQAATEQEQEVQTGNECPPGTC